MIWQLEFLQNLRILAILKNIGWHEYIKAPWNYDGENPITQVQCLRRMLVHI